MDNHYHLLLETALPNLSKILHRLNSSYTTYFSKKRKRPGHLLQGRPKVLLVDRDSYAQELSRYIHLNPVKAGIVRLPEEYHWSSYIHYFKKMPLPSYIETSLLLGQLDGREHVARRMMREFVHSGRTGKLPDPFKDVQGGAILGSPSFVEWVRKKFLKGRKKHRDLPGLRPLKSVELAFVRDLVEKRVKHDPRLAKKASIYLCRKYSERSLGGAVRVFRRDECFRSEPGSQTIGSTTINRQMGG
jgi:putative transposase